MSPALSYIDGALCVDGVPLEAIAGRFGTPCYVYSRADLLARYQAYVDAFAGHRARICYAVKANGNLAVLGALADAGAGFDIVSRGELERVLAAGGHPDGIVFSGAAKLTHELERALEAGVRCFNVESAAELELLSELAARRGRTAPVALRVNPDVEAGGHPHISTGRRDHKFGISMDEAGAAAERAMGLPGIRLTGLACHIGSQMTDLSPLSTALQQLAQLARELAGSGAALTHLDAGGGLGIDHDGLTAPPPAEYARVVVEALSASGLEIVVEPGRSIAGPAGLLLTRVAYVKDSHQRRFALVDGAMNDLLRPALYGARHPILPVREAPPAGSVDVVGPVCETGDFLGRERPLAVGSGDLLAVADAGAYGFVMSSNYNARPRAAEVMVAHGEARLVRRRETVEDLWQGEARFEEARP
ncbi:MAG: diaminopimelate decarboxylase [Gammaproteobacteria bacterium]